jgi:transposase-like protein
LFPKINRISNKINGNKMTKKQSRNFTSEIKKKIVLEMLKEELTIAQLSAKYEISAKTMGNWKRQFLNNAALVFEPSKSISEYKTQINDLENQNDQLAKVLQLGRATVFKYLKEWKNQ